MRALCGSIITAGAMRRMATDATAKANQSDGAGLVGQGSQPAQGSAGYRGGITPRRRHATP
jgi:hypothetical protein